jgi:hypothetical protein
VLLQALLVHEPPLQDVATKSDIEFIDREILLSQGVYEGLSWKLGLARLAGYEGPFAKAWSAAIKRVFSK